MRDEQEALRKAEKKTLKNCAAENAKLKDGLAEKDKTIVEFRKMIKAKDKEILELRNEVRTLTNLRGKRVLEAVKTRAAENANLKDELAERDEMLAEIRKNFEAKCKEMQELRNEVKTLRKVREKLLGRRGSP